MASSQGSNNALSIDEWSVALTNICPEGTITAEIPPRQQEGADPASSSGLNLNINDVDDGNFQQQQEEEDVQAYNIETDEWSIVLSVIPSLKAPDAAHAPTDPMEPATPQQKPQQEKDVAPREAIVTTSRGNISVEEKPTFRSAAVPVADALGTLHIPSDTDGYPFLTLVVMHLQDGLLNQYRIEKVKDLPSGSYLRIHNNNDKNGTDEMPVIVGDFAVAQYLMRTSTKEDSSVASMAQMDSWVDLAQSMMLLQGGYDGWASEALPRLEHALSEKSLLVHDLQATLADIAVVTAMGFLTTKDMKDFWTKVAVEFPNTSKWIKKVLSIPAIQETCRYAGRDVVIPMNGGVVNSQPAISDRGVEFTTSTAEPVQNGTANNYNYNNNNNNNNKCDEIHVGGREVDFPLVTLSVIGHAGTMGTYKIVKGAQQTHLRLLDGTTVVGDMAMAIYLLKSMDAPSSLLPEASNPARMAQIDGWIDFARSVLYLSDKLPEIATTLEDSLPESQSFLVDDRLSLADWALFASVVLGSDPAALEKVSGRVQSHVQTIARLPAIQESLSLLGKSIGSLGEQSRAPAAPAKQEQKPATANQEQTAVASSITPRAALPTIVDASPERYQYVSYADDVMNANRPTGAVQPFRLACDELVSGMLSYGRTKAEKTASVVTQTSRSIVVAPTEPVKTRDVSLPLQETTQHTTTNDAAFATKTVVPFDPRDLSLMYYGAGLVEVGSVAKAVEAFICPPNSTMGTNTTATEVEDEIEPEPEPVATTTGRGVDILEQSAATREVQIPPIDVDKSTKDIAVAVPTSESEPKRYGLDIDEWAIALTTVSSEGGFAETNDSKVGLVDLSTKKSVVGKPVSDEPTKSRSAAVLPFSIAMDEWSVALTNISHVSLDKQDAPPAAKKEPVLETTNGKTRELTIPVDSEPAPTQVVATKKLPPAKKERALPIVEPVQHTVKATEKTAATTTKSRDLHMPDATKAVKEDIALPKEAKRTTEINWTSHSLEVDEWATALTIVSTEGKFEGSAAMIDFSKRTSVVKSVASESEKTKSSTVLPFSLAMDEWSVALTNITELPGKSVEGSADSKTSLGASEAKPRELNLAVSAEPAKDMSTAVLNGTKVEPVSRDLVLVPQESAAINDQPSLMPSYERTDLSQLSMQCYMGDDKGVVSVGIGSVSGSLKRAMPARKVIVPVLKSAGVTPEPPVAVPKKQATVSREIPSVKPVERPADKNKQAVACLVNASHDKVSALTNIVLKNVGQGSSHQSPYESISYAVRLQRQARPVLPATTTASVDSSIDEMQSSLSSFSAEFRQKTKATVVPKEEGEGVASRSLPLFSKEPTTGKLQSESPETKPATPAEEVLAVPVVVNSREIALPIGDPATGEDNADASVSNDPESDIAKTDDVQKTEPVETTDVGTSRSISLPIGEEVVGTDSVEPKVLASSEADVVQNAAPEEASVPKPSTDVDAEVESATLNSREIVLPDHEVMASKREAQVTTSRELAGFSSKSPSAVDDKENVENRSSKGKKAESKAPTRNYASVVKGDASGQQSRRLPSVHASAMVATKKPITPQQDPENDDVESVTALLLAAGFDVGKDARELHAIANGRQETLHGQKQNRSMKDSQKENISKQPSNESLKTAASKERAMAVAKKNMEMRTQKRGSFIEVKQSGLDKAYMAAAILDAEIEAEYEDEAQTDKVAEGEVEDKVRQTEELIETAGRDLKRAPSDGGETEMEGDILNFITGVEDSLDTALKEFIGKPRPESVAAANAQIAMSETKGAVEASETKASESKGSNAKASESKTGDTKASEAKASKSRALSVHTPKSETVKVRTRSLGAGMLRGLGEEQPSATKSDQEGKGEADQSVHPILKVKTPEASSRRHSTPNKTVHFNHVVAKKRGSKIKKKVSTKCPFFNEEVKRCQRLIWLDGCSFRRCGLVVHRVLRVATLASTVTRTLFSLATTGTLPSGLRMRSGYNAI